MASTLISCGGGDGNDAAPNNGTPGSNLNLPPGDGVFTSAPIDINAITRLDPLGWINPPGGHTLPTDHVYFYFNGPGPNPPIISPPPILPVYAPGSGTVVLVQTGTSAPFDSSIMIRMTGTFVYYLAHIIPTSNIGVGTTVQAGQVIGQTNGLGGANAVDMGVINERITLTGFANPNRYLWQQIHCDSPYKYFAEPLKSQLYAMVLRTGTDKDGHIDYDVVGTLQGNWFHESVPVTESAGPNAWPKQLAFVPDPQDPSDPRISISSYLPQPGKWRPGAGTPAFASVTPATGKVAYPLMYLEGNTQAGLMLVQMLDNARIQVEVFAGSQQSDANFTGNALIYTR